MKTGLGRHQPLQRGDRGRVVDFPEPVGHAEVVGGFLRGLVADAGLGGLDHLAIVVRVEAEDRAEVEPGGVEERQAVGLGAGEGVLVRIDPARAERFEADPGEEPLAGVGLALDLEGLAVEVVRRVGVLAEDAAPEPLLEEAGGPGVAVRLGRIAGLLAVQLEADDVVGAGIVKLVLEGGVDHVVGGATTSDIAPTWAMSYRMPRKARMSGMGEAVRPVPGR